jgi:hypothetical protein
MCTEDVKNSSIIPSVWVSAQKVVQTLFLSAWKVVQKSCTNFTSVSSTESYQFTSTKCAQEKMNENIKPHCMMDDHRACTP